MIRSFNGKTPRVADSAFVSEAAYVIGDVEIGEDSGIFPGAVIRADFGSIKIGCNTMIEDNSVLHSGIPLEVGDNVTIGHSVVMHGLSIGNNTLIGNNATVLDNAQVGSFCIIGAGCLVSQGMVIPDYSFVVGVPAEIKRQISPQQRQRRIPGAARNLTYAQLVKLYKEQGL
jgi:carbonic anhydrase/acetyltransferase-like protein (isoleucine patch superfamily)